MKSLLLKKPFRSEFSFLFIRLLLRYNWHLMEHVRWACAVGWVTTRARLEATVSIRGVSTPRAPESLLVSPSPHPVPCKPPICSVAADWFPCFRIFYGITEDVLFFFFFSCFRLLSRSRIILRFMHVVASVHTLFLFCCRAVFCMDIPTTVYHSPAEECLVISGLRLLEIKLLWTHVYKFLCGHMLSFPLVGSFKEDWLDLELDTCLRF